MEDLFQAHYPVLLIIYFIKFIAKIVKAALNMKQLDVKHYNLIAQTAIKIMKKSFTVALTWDIVLIYICIYIYIYIYIYIDR